MAADSAARIPLDVATVAAIGVVAFALGDLGHEGAGHGLACVALGSHIRQISTVHLDCDESRLSAGAIRAVYAAGTLLNLLLSVLFAIAVRRSRARGVLRFFLWFSAVYNGLSGGGYLMTSPIFGFGDWNGFVDGLPWIWAWRVALSAAGVAIGLAALQFGASTIGPFVGDGPDRMRRAWIVCAVPYVAAGVLSTAGAALNPLHLLLTGAMAAFLGNCWLLWLPGWLKGRAPSPETDPLPRSVGWLVAAAVAAAIFIAGFAPGLPRVAAG